MIQSHEHTHHHHPEAVGGMLWFAGNLNTHCKALRIIQQLWVNPALDGKMFASEGNIRGNVDSLVKIVAALETAGVELINEGAVSEGGGRGVRLQR